MAETPYESEDLIQSLLEQHPEILGGDQFGDAEPRRWILLAREMAVPDHAGAGQRWALDHLFVDQDAVPTLVEVERKSDSRSRREVVGQMLDYAANGPAFWELADLKNAFVKTQHARSLEPAEALMTFLGDDRDEEVFWATVMSYLRAGRLRLVFVVDSFPPELLRIVEFLAAHLKDIEVFLVEVRQHTGSSGRLLATTVRGSEAIPPIAQVLATMTESEWIAAFRAKNGESRAEVAQFMIDWMSKRGMVFLTKAQSPSFGMYVQHGKIRYYPFFIKPNGKFAIQLYYLMKSPAFQNEQDRIEVMSRAGAALGVDFSGTHVRGEVLATMDQLTDPSQRDRLYEVLLWILDQIGLAVTSPSEVIRQITK